MFGNISIWQLLIVLVIILLLFGTKKLRNAGGDIGSAMKNFKKAFKDEEDKGEETSNDSSTKKSHLNDDRADNTQDAHFSESKDTEDNKKS